MTSEAHLEHPSRAHLEHSWSSPNLRSDGNQKRQDATELNWENKQGTEYLSECYSF